MNEHTRRPALSRFAFLVWIAATALAFFASNVAVTAQEPLPSAAEIFKANVAADAPLLNPFQLRAQLEVDGSQIADLTLGWSGGAIVSLQARLSTMPGFGEIAAALRPSGFALIKVGSSSQVLAPLVPYSQFLELLPRLANRALLADIIDSLASSARLIGETEIQGRRAYIIEWTLQPQAILAGMKTSLTRLATDDEVASLLADMGVPLDQVLEAWDVEIPEFIEAISADSALPPLTYRQYVDAQNHVTLKNEVDIPEDLQSDELLTPFTPQVELEEIITGEDGQIEKLVWHVTLDLPVQELVYIYATLADTVVTTTADAAAEAESNEAANEEAPVDSQSPSLALDLRITLQRVGGGYLPAEISGRVRADRAALSVLEALQPLDEGSEELLLAPEPSSEPVEHTFRLTLRWDTTRGAEPALVEDTRLLDAERSWQQAQAAVQADDWEAAIPPLARLTRQVPTFVLAHLYLSDAYEKVGEIWSAIGELEQVVMLQPQNWLALNNLAYTYVDHDIDAERGLELALEAYDLVPDPAPAFLLDTLGWAYYKNGQLEAASWYLEESSIQLTEENKAGMYEPEEYAEYAGILHYHLGAVYAARGMYDQAKVHLEISLQHDPDLTEAHELLTQVNEALAEAPAES
ncbi:MAG: hypothetical protein IMX00_04920 [Limnochordales bacterium]|nr:hypothetical protein [Limnochordales bacterium]